MSTEEYEPRTPSAEKVAQAAAVRLFFDDPLRQGTPLFDDPLRQGTWSHPANSEEERFRQLETLREVGAFLKRWRAATRG